MKTSFSFLSTLFCLLLLWVVSCKKTEDTPVTPTPTKSSEKAISAFAFSALNPAVNATVDAATKAISVTVTAGTDVTKLVPTITTSAKATVSPASGAVQDFTNPVTYTVTAEDGTNQTYITTVTKSAALKSSAKNILTVSFTGASPAVKATVDTTAKTITALLPAGTDVTKLVPTIMVSDKATISPATGVAQDFSKAVPYTVTAEDGSTKVFSVSAATDAYYFATVRMTVNETSDRLTDSCLIDYKTGTVFQLKDGAKYADRIDGLLNGYCNLEMYTPANVILCGGSCGVGKLNGIIVGQKWSTYRKGGVEFITKNSVTADNGYTSSDKWNELSFSTDIAALVDKTKLKAEGGAADYTVVADDAVGGANCAPSVLFDKVLYRFITQDGKKGVMRMKQLGKKGTGYFIVFDIKIQK
ncbi:DUF5018 domain-containing protein [Spirosoma areae]